MFWIRSAVSWMRRYGPNWPHNGDVAVLDFSDGVLRIRLTGQCSGCPSASITTENLIAAEVRARVPEVRDVVLVNGVSDSLLAQARALLAERRA